jgi:sarcosine oxidase subunit beta
VRTEILSPEEVVHRWPELDVDGVALACYEETSGYADPVQTVQSLVRSAQHNGLQVYEGCEVLGITRSNGSVGGVVTGDGEIATGVVVNACGPWGDRIGRMVGVDYPISFSREHEAVFEAPEGFGDLPVMSDVTQRLYFRRYGDGNVLVGEGWPKQAEPADPESYDDGTDDEHLGRMVPKLLRRLPSLAPRLTQPDFGGAYVTGYSGVYDITEDWYPIVGQEEIQGYYSCFGGSGHCFKLGPALGESLAAVIAGQQPPIDISSLSGSRFSEGHTFGSVWGPGNRA